jgi:hypothetical protein
MAKFNEQKGLAAILFLANITGKIDLYALLKTLYYAEKYHLQKWGRTITGDVPCRLPYGPVPSNMYDMLKSVRGDGYWPRELSDSLCFIDPKTIVPKKEPDLNRLSDTDVEELKRSFDERGLNSFKDLCEEAHKDPAFIRSRTGRMTDEDLAEDDPILLEHLQEVRENEQFLNDWRFFAPADEEAICS